MILKLNLCMSSTMKGSIFSGKKALNTQFSWYFHLKGGKLWNGCAISLSFSGLLLKYEKKFNDSALHSQNHNVSPSVFQ